MMIRELRQAKNLSQQQLGKASNLDQSQISRIERGDLVPHRIGRRLLIRSDSLTRYIDQSMPSAHNSASAGPDVRSLTGEQRTCNDRATTKTKTASTNVQTLHTIVSPDVV